MQGLFSNDVKSLQAPEKGTEARIPGFFLNTKGRILSDALLFRPSILADGQMEFDKNRIMIDCPKEKAEELEKHLKRHTIRRKAIVSALNEMQIYAMFSPNQVITQEDAKEMDFISENETNQSKAGDL